MTARRIIWLASYPKSGNTWLRLFLEAYLAPKGEKLDLNAMRRLTSGDALQRLYDRAAGGSFRGKSVEDWLSVRPKALRLLVDSQPGVHFVKTHSRARKYEGHNLIPPELTQAAIYLMRNPFDVAPSYARHLRCDVDGAITRITNANHCLATDTRILEIVGRWDSHVESWTTAPGLTRHVMRYEDMVAEPERTFRALLEFLGMPVDFGKLRWALRQTSFDALRKQERERGFRERPEGMPNFFARGRPGGWREELTRAQLAHLRAEFLPALERWYPELIAETEAFAGAMP